MLYHKCSRLKDPEHYYITLLQLYMPWRNESDLQRRLLSYEEKFEHIETEMLPNISHFYCFYGIYDDEDLMNITYGSVDEADIDKSSGKFGMLKPDLLDLELQVQGNVENVIGPVSSTMEDLSVSREELYAFLFTTE